jgi:hypothetical protein
MNSKVFTEEALEYKMAAYFCFIDLEKAFDRLDIKTVPNILEASNVPNGLVLLIKDTYENNSFRVKSDGKLSGKIPVREGPKETR